MKITDTRIGQQTLKVAESIATKVEKSETATPLAQTAPTKAPVDKFELQQQIKSETKELAKLLEQVNTLMGPEAVRELRNALPKAALDALETAAPALPLLPGKGVYATYRAKLEQLLQFEGDARGVRNAGYKAQKSSVFDGAYSNSEYPKKEMTQAVAQLMSGKALNQVWVEDLHERGCGRPGKPVEMRDLQRYVADLHSINDAIKKAWPYGEVPGALLLRDEFGRGPGTGRVEQLGYGSHMPSTAEVRSMIPGYAQTLKEVIQLQAALKDKAFPSNDEIKTSKTQLMNKELSIGEMHQEVATLLQEVQGMANSSEIKRETLKGTHESRTEKHGESFSRDPAFGIKMNGSESHSVSTTQGSSTSQQLNLKARSFEFVTVPNLEGTTLGQVEKSNYLTPVETGIALEKLLRAARVYEAMVALYPSAPETQGLRMFMEESTFSFKPQNDDYQTKGQGAGNLKMADLRQDLLKLKDTGLYPADRYDIVKQEIQEGPPRPASKLAGNRSLAEL